MKRTVLVLDDDSAVAGFVIAILQHAGFSVLQATTGDEAIRLVESNSDPIRLLIADAILGTASGRTVVDQIWVHRPELKVLFISGYPMADLISRGILAPTDIESRRISFLQKPFMPAELLRAIKNTLLKDAAADDDVR